MSSSNSDFVWYASYGSNLCEDRFLCYIKGGKPAGSTKVEIGCRDQSLPLETRSVELEFPLYFSAYSSRWGGGVAFVGTTNREQQKTLGRMYLITKEQFIDVVKQENKLTDLVIDFSKVVEDGSHVTKESLYGNILYAGDCDGYPIFTFTYYHDQDAREVTVPSENYLTMLIRGYKETYSLTDEQIANYLITKPGVKGNIEKGVLLKLIEKV
jgi:hypothetical protein